MEHYKSTFKSRFSHISNTYFILIGIVCLIFFISNKIPGSDFGMFIFITLSVFGILIFPSAWLHITYFLANKGDVLEIYPEQSLISFSHRGKDWEFYFYEIRQIDQFKTYALLRNATGWLPWDTYNFVVITLKSGRQFVITCFLANELSLPIEPERVKLHKVVFPYLRKADVFSSSKIGQNIPSVFRQKVKTKSKKELESIVQSLNEYDEKFIEAAREELKMRGF